MDGLSLAWNTLTGTPAVFAAIGGVAWGIIGGALPGISPSIALALLLPFTYGMDPITAIVLLGATYVGAEYGGSIPAILINTPGTHAAAATVVDGYYMHCEGRGGEALGISLQSGVIGGLIGLIFLIVFTEPLSRVALAFNVPAYFALGILGLSVIVSLSGGSLIKGMMAATLGLMIATIGTDPLSGVSRFTFGQPELLTGIEYFIVMVGVFAMSELMMTANTPDWGKTDQRQTRIRLPGFAKWRKLWRAQAIGSGVGIFEGVMPGAGGSIAAFMSYNEARRWSSEPEKFGKGSEEGIAAPEAANNAVACTALVPVLSFGIPGSNSAAILMGGMLIHGLQPGPMLFQKEPEFVYGLFGGLAVANVSQLFLGMMMTPALWLVNRPKPYLMAAIFGLVFSGIYSIHNDTYDLYLVSLFGLVGYLLRVFGFPFLPLVLGLVLDCLVEANYRRSLELTGGDHSIFVDTPIALGLLIAAAVLVAGSAVRDVLMARKAARQVAQGTAPRFGCCTSAPVRPRPGPRPQDQLAWKLAELAAAPRPLDPDAAAMAGCRLVDNAAVGIAALNRAPAAAARAQALCFARPGGARLLGLPPAVRVDCTWAAWANATAVRELDFHDSFFALDSSHPADAIMPPMAVAQQARRSGADLVRAILVAYQVQTALVQGLPLQRHRIDHMAHLGPAVAAGLGALPVPVTYQAVSLAAHLSLGTRQVRKGQISSRKAFAPGHVGNARSRRSTARCGAKARPRRSTKATMASWPCCWRGPRPRCRCPTRTSPAARSCRPCPRRIRRAITARRSSTWRCGCTGGSTRGRSCRSRCKPSG